MPKRENFSTSLKYPNCKLVGRAQWSENENPVHGDGLDSTLDSVTDGFLIDHNKNLQGDTKILCSKCNITIAN